MTTVTLDRTARRDAAAADAVARAAEPFDDLERADLAPLLDRVGDARMVLLGGSTHGTSEFYRFRARLTRELVLHRGFRFVAVEADWPDAARIDDYVRHAGRPRRGDWRAFARFPTWMWRNREVRRFVDELAELNASGPRSAGWPSTASTSTAQRRGEHNVGQLCRRAFGREAYLVGLGTHAGTVAAASAWEAPMELKRVRPSHPESYERLCHDAGLPGFLVGLGAPFGL